MMPIDYKKYPVNWKSEIVPAIIKRSGNCCELCGLENGQIVWGIKLWVKNDKGRYTLRSIWFRDRRDAVREHDFSLREIKVVLTIAHLDHDELNHSVELDRLKALCQCCHLRYDADEKYRRLTEKWNKSSQKLFI